MGKGCHAVKLVLAVGQDKDAPGLTSALIHAGYSVTKINSTGGFLREGNTTLMLGVEDSQVEDVITIVKRICRSREQSFIPYSPGPDGMMGVSPVNVIVGGATLFVLPVHSYEKV